MVLVKKINFDSLFSMPDTRQGHVPIMISLQINIQEPYLSFVLNGEKTIEGRLYKGKFKELKVGDFLLVGQYEKKIPIVGLTRYPNFKQMLEMEGVAAVIPDKATVEEAEAVYRLFYTKDMEDEYGVIAIKLGNLDRK
jgi:ASC-1-like (ASCH) protein